MKRLILLLLLTGIASLHLPAQGTFYAGFESGIYPRGFKRILQTSDQGLAVMAGGVEKNILKLDANMDEQWAYHFDSVHVFFEMVATNDDGILLLGHGNVNTTSLILIKIDQAGSIVFQKQIKYYLNGASISGWDMINAHDDGFLILGGNCVAENYAIRLDRDANILWSRQYPDITEAGTGTIFEAVKTGTDSYLLVSTNRSMSFYQIDDSGNMAWHKHYDVGNPQTYPTQVLSLPGGGYFVAGFFNVGSAGSTQWAAGLSSTGAITWLKSYDVPGSTILGDPQALILTPSNEIYLFGYANLSSNQNNQYLVTKLDLQGNVLSSTISGSDFFQYGFDEIGDAIPAGTDFIAAGHSAYDKNTIARISTTGGGPGFCNSAPLNVVATDILSTVTPLFDQVNPSPFQVVATTLNWTPTPVSYVRTVYCGSVPLAADEAEGQSLKVWPQPASSAMEIGHPQLLQGGLLRLWDLQGRLLREQILPAGSRTTQLDNLSATPGVHLLEITGDGQTWRTKVVLQ